MKVTKYLNQIKAKKIFLKNRKLFFKLKKIQFKNSNFIKAHTHE